MSKYVTAAFTFLVNVLHYVFGVLLVICLIEKDYIGSLFGTYISTTMMIAYVVGALISYIITFGFLSTIITIKDQLIELNQTMKQINLPK